MGEGEEERREGRERRDGEKRRDGRERIEIEGERGEKGQSMRRYHRLILK